MSRGIFPCLQEPANNSEASRSVFRGIGRFPLPARTDSTAEKKKEGDATGGRRGGEEGGRRRGNAVAAAAAVDSTMAAAKGKRVYLTWTDEMDSALLAVLVEHHNNGDHAQNGWKPHVYNAAIRNVREKCNVGITKENIASRCKTFDKHYEIISKILSQSGFGWDWENNKLSIDSDDVWTRYVEGNKAAACYKNKVVKNWDAISTIYSTDHANGEGAKTGAESAQESPEQADDASPDLPQKRLRTGEAILCMLGDMKTSFSDALKSTEPLQLPQVTPPAEILAALQMIPELPRCDMLQSYGKLILNERLFQALMQLPMAMRKEWLLMMNEKNGN